MKPQEAVEQFIEKLTEVCEKQLTGNYVVSVEIGKGKIRDLDRVFEVKLK